MVAVFIMGPELQEAARRVRAYAERPENLYVLGGPPPGDNPLYCLRSGTIRAVFSWTQAPGYVLRHMSISTSKARAKRTYPQPIIVWTMAYHFGFNGVVPDKHGLVHAPGPEWRFVRDPVESCVVVQQLVYTDPIAA